MALLRVLRVWAVLACLPACAQIESCRNQGKLPIVYVDIVDRVSEGEGLEIRRARLEEAARTVMDEWSDFAFRQASPKEIGWQLDVRILLASERTADPEAGRAPDVNRVRRAVEVQLRLHALSSVERPPGEFMTQALVAKDVPKSQPFDEVAHAAVLEGAERLERMMQLSWGSEDEVVRALRSKEEWLRGAAAQSALDRRVAAAVPVLMERIRDEQEVPSVVTKAVGALVAIGDPQGAAAIIDACRRRDAPYLVQMIFALGALGGREAEGYLFTVQSGHPSPQIREAAAQALEELEKGRAAARKAADGGAPAP